MMRLVKYSGILILSAVLLWVIAENYLRLSGYELPVVKHEGLAGWGNRSGSFRSEEDPNVFENCWRNGQRISRSDIYKQGKYRVAVFGCSYTYGTGVADQDTFCYQLNEQFPDIVFDNYGVGGYGTFTCLLLMEKVLLEADQYDLVLYCAHRDHLNRNVRPDIMMAGAHHFDPLAIPSVLVKNGKLVKFIPSSVPSEWLASSYVVSFFRRSYYGYQLQHSNVDVHDQDDFVLKQAFLLLVREMDALAKSVHTPFALVTLDNRHFTDSGELEGSYFYPGAVVDFTTINAQSKHINDPQYKVKGDMKNHPNKLMHKEWADKIGSWIRQQEMFK